MTERIGTKMEVTNPALQESEIVLSGADHKPKQLWKSQGIKKT